MRFHHLGIASSKLDRDRRRYEGLGYVPSTDVIVDVGLGVRLQFLELAGAPRIELVAPLEGATESPVTSWVDRGIHAYHHAYEVVDLESAINDQATRGGFLVAAPHPAVAFDGRPVAFVTLTPSMLLEFIQEP